MSRSVHAECVHRGVIDTEASSQHADIMLKSRSQNTHLEYIDPCGAEANLSS